LKLQPSAPRSSLENRQPTTCVLKEAAADIFFGDILRV